MRFAKKIGLLAVLAIAVTTWIGMQAQAADDDFPHIVSCGAPMSAGSAY